MHVSVPSTSVSHRIIKSCSELKLPWASTRTICIINTIYLSAFKLWFLIKGTLTQFEIKKNHLFCVKWFTCAFCMIDQNLNFRSQVLRDVKVTMVRTHCYLNTAKKIYLFTNKVRLGITFLWQNVLWENLINWFNGTTDNIINRRSNLYQYITNICKQ